MSNPNQYTIGWICAITTEYVAAQAFLDEKHDGPENVSPNDSNIYTLGKVRKHNVVIAVLPDGEYGIAAAASVAKDMLHSFPNVRIGLMVGIGGGVPSREHDIRLGDIVVSASRDKNGGVFQYDFGKTIQDQTFRTTGFLNQPPALLRAAVSDIKAQYEGEGHCLNDAINSVLEKKPKLRKKYKRPDPSSDRLYQSEITHPSNDQTSCAAACGDDLSELILRPERSSDDDNPAIHYGLIASANQLMKDALVRDKLAIENDVLCFEMEAAGLMNQFPCLVIRGICDYSDSHKNKEWQGYAAIAAAAYAKDLLCRIPLNKVEIEMRIGDILSGVQGSVDKLLRRQHDQEHETILKWLTLVDYALQQSDYIRSRQSETGQWLLDTEQYQTWLKINRQTLFCSGIPGAGKTILTSVVIDDLNTRFQNEPSVGIAYLYFNFRQHDEQKAESLLASLLKQLSQEQPSLPDSVKALYDLHKKKRTLPSFDEISRTLQSVAAMYSKVFIVVDALDECQASDRCLSKFLSEIFSLQAKTGISFFATSRPIPDIEREFKGYPSCEILASDKDIRRYLNGHMSLLPEFVLKRPDLQEEIITKITEAVEGMFLLAQLYFGSLEDKTSAREIKNVLTDIQKQNQGGSAKDKKLNALAQAYEHAMERIDGQKPGFRLLAKKILFWITCAKRPFTMLELQHALAVNIGDCNLDNENLREIDSMVSVCAGLVTVDKESNIIRLVHYTTQEYFERTQEKWFPNAESDITAICVTYLSFSVFGSGFCQTDAEFEERLRLNQIYNYAAHNWGNHAREASALCQEVIGFLESELKVEAASQALLAIKKYQGHSGYSQEVPKRMRGVHLAAYFGLREAMIALLNNGHNPDSKNIYSQTPLSWAARNGHEAVVKLLLETGKVDMDSKDKNGRTALSWAARNGHEAVVKLLLETGKVDMDSKDKNGQTALLWAARNGHEAVVKLLLDTGKVDMDSKDEYGQTALSWAAERGHEAVVKLLLETGKVDMDSKDEYGRTALLWAAENRHEAVVKLLLETGKVDADSKDENYGQTALSLAARNGHEAVVKLLLETGKVDADSKDENGQTALSLAARNGHEAVVRLLLETGKVDADSKDENYGQTALSWAAERGHEAVVKLLRSSTK